MSFEAMTWAVKQKVPAMQKIVLLMLANRTSSDNGLCFPSHDRLADDCGMTKRSVIQQIEKLEKGNFLTVIRETKNKTKQVNKYRLNLGGMPPPVVNDVHQGSESHSLGVVNDVHQGSESRSLGVVNDVHQGSESRSLGVVNDVHIKHTLETVTQTDILNTHTNTPPPPKSQKRANPSVCAENLTAEQKECFEWGKQHYFWAEQVQDVKRFVTLYNSKSARGIKRQFEEYKANEKQQAQKNPQATANQNAGSLGSINGSQSGDNNYGTNRRATQQRTRTREDYLNDPTPF